MADRVFKTLKSMLDKKAMLEGFYALPDAYDRLRTFSGLHPTDEQLAAFESMVPLCEMKHWEDERAGRKNARYTYDEINRHLEGFASIEPDTKGGYMIVYQEHMDPISMKAPEGIDLTNMNPEQLETTAREVEHNIQAYLYVRMKPALEKWVKAQEPLQMRSDPATYPSIATLNEWAKRGRIVFEYPHSKSIAAIVNDMTIWNLTPDQVYTMGMLRSQVNNDHHELSGKAQNKARYTYHDLNQQMHGVAELHLGADGAWLLGFPQIRQEVPINIRGGTAAEMSGPEYIELARTVETAFFTTLYREMEFEMKHHIADFAPIEQKRLEEEQQKARALKAKLDAQHKENLMAKVKEALGEDEMRVSFNDKTSSGGQEIFSLGHPEFKIFYKAKNPDDFFNKLKHIYPSFQKKLNAYEALLTETRSKYGLEWEIGKETISAKIKDFDLDGELRTFNHKRCKGGDDILAWMHKVMDRIHTLQEKRAAQFLALGNEGFEIESIPSADKLSRKIRICNPGQADYLEAETMGSEGLFTHEAMKLIREAPGRLRPKAASAAPAELPGHEAHKAEVRKTELVIDNASFGLLAIPRQSSDTWLPFLHMAKMLPSVERITIPSIIADFEACGCLPPAPGQKEPEVIDPALYRKSKERVQFLASATRIRIHEDGREEVLAAGDPKLVIFESAKQDEFYKELRDWQKQAKDAGIIFSEQLPFLRDESGKDAGESAIFDYCQRLSKHKPVVVTDDFNTIYRHMFLMDRGDKDDHLCTPNGIGIGFSSTRGLVNAVNLAYDNMALHFFNRLTPKAKETDVSVSRVGRAIKERGNKLDSDIFNGETPDYIAGRGRGSRHEMQLHYRLQGDGRSWLIQEGMHTKQLLDSGFEQLKKRYPYLMSGGKAVGG